MTFVHLTPERIGRQLQKDDLPMFTTSIHWSHRHSLRRFATVYGQLFATDMFQTHYFARPPRHARPHNPLRPRRQSGRRARHL